MEQLLEENEICLIDAKRNKNGGRIGEGLRLKICKLPRREEKIHVFFLFCYLIIQFAQTCSNKKVSQFSFLM